MAVFFTHDTLQLPAYGGSLFDPDRFPFLEGREQRTHWQETGAEPLRINNRIVLHLLEALQILQIRVPGGGVEPRRLSFRALDIEQIGHVYEGLLDHTAVRATSIVLGLVGTRYEEPEVALAELERFQAQGEAALLAWLKEQTGRSLSALKKALSAELEPRDQQRLRSACNNDSALFDRVLPFAGLIRQDTLGYPVVIPAGAVYMTEGVDRRQSGTHYTPRNLTEEIVQYTLEPLVYEGVAESKPKEEWRLRSPAELLQLKICDMAMGSGAFLVQTCRYLAGKLVEAWQQAEAEHPGQVVIAPDGTLSEARPEECPIPKDLDERLLVARRIVADRCLYGVDKNPLAAEMAKLSLWLVTLAKGRPFTFLDHAFKWGDSLLGITRAEQIESLNLNPDNEAVQYPIASQIWQPILQDAIAKRRQLESFSVNGIEDLQEKERLFEEAEQAIDRLRFVGDYLIGRALADAGKTPDLTTEDLMVVSQRIEQELAGKATEEQTRDITSLKASAERMLNLGNPANQPPRKPFHWLLEFPEVFLEGETKGFSVIVGNPPFMWGMRITTTLGNDYFNSFKEQSTVSPGTADLCAYFFNRGFSLLKPVGYMGLIATNTISQGDTREFALDKLIHEGALIYRAIKSMSWASGATVEVAVVYISKNNLYHGQRYLDGQPTTEISSFLDARASLHVANRLVNNQGKGFIGHYAMGRGFILAVDDAKNLTQKDSRNAEIIFPFLNSKDLNDSPIQEASRFAINFGERSLEEAACYPDCLTIVEAKVKPERDQANRKANRERWWRYAETRPGLTKAIKLLAYVFVQASPSKYLAISRVSSKQVFAHPMAVFPFETFDFFSAISSNFHESWTLNYCSTMRNDVRYTPSDVMETFPFPTPDPSDLSAQFPTLNTIGETYYTHRQAVMRDRQEGLTKTYNRFHDPNETADDIQKLRELHIEMDREVANAYSWQDLDLGHDFHTTKQGIRFTISETARREVLDRLLELNHQRYAEEVAQGLHHKKGKSKKAKGKTTKKQKTTGDSPQEKQISLF
jgi:hypothetical protein